MVKVAFGYPVMSKAAALLTLPAAIRVTPPLEVRLSSVEISTIPAEGPAAMFPNLRSADFVISMG